MTARRTIFILLSLLIVVFIFLNSAQVSTDSTGRSRIVTEMLIKLFVRDYESLSGSEQTALIDRFEHAVRKLAHFCEYAALGFVLTLCFFEFPKLGGTAHNAIMCAVAVCCVYAISDEIHQMFVAGRTAKVTDMLIDTAGAALASLIATWLHLTLKRIREKRDRTA